MHCLGASVQTHASKHPSTPNISLDPKATRWRPFSLPSEGATDICNILRTNSQSSFTLASLDLLDRFLLSLCPQSGEHGLDIPLLSLCPPHILCQIDREGLCKVLRMNRTRDEWTRSIDSFNSHSMITQ